MAGEYIQIKNIGRIKEAYVKLDGLNIITGKNDTGKSTIGKVIFSIVKAINRYKEDFQSNKEENIFKLVENLYFTLRRNIATSQEFVDMKILFFPPDFMEEIRQLIDNNYNDEIINNVLEKRRKFIEINIEKEKQEEYYKIIDKINSILSEKGYRSEQIIDALNKAFVSEFRSELLPKNAKNKNSEIGYYSVNKIFEAVIEKNIVRKLSLTDEILFKDVTYVESPVYLQLAGIIDNADTLFDIDLDKDRRLVRNKPQTSLHIKDLINKLKLSKYFPDFQTENIELLSRITQIIEGRFFYDDEQSEFKFEKQGSSTIQAINTASGVKAFGIIQLLLEANTLDERSLLIIDEPENHLHPEWQIKYADIITELVRENISVIINSHNPYMIQALNYFVKKKDLKNYTKYYLTEKDNDLQLVNFKDITNDVDSVFRLLAEPINKIMW